MFGHCARIGQLAVGVFRVSDGKCFNRRAPQLSHQRGDGARIKSAAEKYSQGYIAHQVTIDRLFQQAAVLLDVVGFAAGRIFACDRQIPIGLDTDISLRIHFHNVTGHQLRNAIVKSLSTGNKSES